ncbi:MAG: hypothetical protein JW716_02470 [Candidatus Aenigmarchaeota archaeon]|nr:hypothetical protein [Candidatus Aenigmarchaeota archaeon]
MNILRAAASYAAGLVYEKKVDVLFPEGAEKKNYGDPTIYFANHMDFVGDSIALLTAFSKNSIYPPGFVIKDDLWHPREKNNEGKIYRNQKFYQWNLIKHKLLYLLINGAGFFPTTRDDSPYWRTDKEIEMKSIIADLGNKKESAIIYPAGKVSRTGEVDYTVEDLPNLLRHNLRIFQRGNDLELGFIHVNCDLPFDKYIVSFGDSIGSGNKRNVSFLEEIEKCSTVTGLQVQSHLNRKGLSGKIGLKEGLEILKKEGLLVVPDYRDAYEIAERTTEYLARNKRRQISRDNGKKIDICSPEYQSNFIKHIRKINEVLK